MFRLNSPLRSFAVLLVLRYNGKATRLLRGSYVTECGNNICGFFEYCCNESCGTCASFFGGSCTEEYCCPEALANNGCSEDYNPVKCSDECVYVNACQADASGQVGCCPTPADDVVCPDIYAPMTCSNGCEYDNDCLAKAAGQDINTCNTMCGPNTCEIGEVRCNESCGICAPPGGVCTEEYCCPTPSKDIFCDTGYAPVVCADGCEYDNKCLAEAAGHEVGTCGNVNCPTPHDGIFCPYLYDPITCDGGCEYDNDCLAKAAGKDINTCNRLKTLEIFDKELCWFC